MRLRGGYRIRQSLLGGDRKTILGWIVSLPKFMSFLESQNLTLFGKGVIADIISWGHTGVQWTLNPYDRCPYMKRSDTHSGRPHEDGGRGWLIMRRPG